MNIVKNISLYCSTNLFILIVIVSSCGELATDKKNLRTTEGELSSSISKNDVIGDLQRRINARANFTKAEKKSFASSQSNHGFGFNLTASEIPAGLDVSKLSAEKATLATNSGLKTQPAPSTIYTGDSLRVDKCETAGFGGSADEANRAMQAFPASAKHLGEILTQPFLFDVFAPQDNWFDTALMSLEEWDPTGVMRAKDPIHPFLRKRLGKATDPGPQYWPLTAVSFRAGNRDAIAEADHTMPIVGQIKISYGLDASAAESDGTILSASLIHSIAINPNFYDDFLYDLLTIRQDKAVSGCDVFRIVDKWTRNNGATVGNPYGFYFFLHANIFDNLKTIPIREWRFTELKPVANDTLEQTRPLDDLSEVVVSVPEESMDMDYEGNTTYTDNRYGKVLPNTERRQSAAELYLSYCSSGAWLKKKIENPFILSTLSDTEKQAAADCPKLPTPAEINSCFATASTTRCTENAAKDIHPITRITEAYENVAFTADSQVEKPEYPQPGKSLRVVTIKNTPLQVEDENSLQTTPRPDLAYSIWFSGTVSDCSQLPSTDSVKTGETSTTNPDAVNNINCRLLIKEDGSRARQDHPAFMFEAAWSCAGCHMRRDDINLKTDNSGLKDIPSMNKAHISFGDGGNRPCNSFLHRSRPNSKVSLSPYFLEFANGYAMNGYLDSPSPTIPPANIGAFGTGDMSGGGPTVDVFRCFSRTLDPGLGF